MTPEDDAPEDDAAPDDALLDKIPEPHPVDALLDKITAQGDTRSGLSIASSRWRTDGRRPLS